MKLVLGNSLESKRDWGYAKEYVEGMWRMLQQDKPDDYVLATNETHTIRAFLDTTFARVNLDWKDYVKFDDRFLRPLREDGSAYWRLLQGPATTRLGAENPHESPGRADGGRRPWLC